MDSKASEEIMAEFIQLWRVNGHSKLILMEFGSGLYQI